MQLRQDFLSNDKRLLDILHDSLNINFKNRLMLINGANRITRDFVGKLRLSNIQYDLP